MLLAIDTSAGTSLAVLDLDGQVNVSHGTHDTRRHAEVLGEYLRDVPAQRITGVVVGVGPGPFTGLRVGIAAARAFAWGANVPLLPLVSHDAIAAARLGARADAVTCVVTDARRREFFVSEYSGMVQGVPQRVRGPRIETALDPSAELADEVSAEWLARIALAKVSAGSAFEPADAVYLRSPDVTLPAHRPERP
ncbi:MAG TPA: tRNA (adenosine(37)-N6)-threonylcarbamoyltransferase complex dimerization subunit type 1 TsaB [Microbacteriaceae bacterium]|nr:tRNA (adenosine(37)-N6)-threonylcarbamoyltransferase complex dimerization subunit type 1 TsaB [Microbacteriaceae bacterium]